MFKKIERNYWGLREPFFLKLFVSVSFLGTKVAAEYTNGVYDMVSPAQSMYFGTLQILHLLEDLKMALEMLKDPQEREALRNQIPGSTAVCIRDWLEENLVSKKIRRKGGGVLIVV